VRDALKALPWVDSDKPIEADVQTRQVKFTIKKAADFDLKVIKQALAAKGFDEVTVLSGPKKP
jgi:hypothetical protein